MSEPEPRRDEVTPDEAEARAAASDQAAASDEAASYREATPSTDATSYDDATPSADAASERAEAERAEADRERAAATTAPIAADPSSTAAARMSRVMGSSWLPPLATGLVGLIIGLAIGATIMGLVATVALHNHRFHGGPGDGRGYHWQDNRPVPPRR